ncbi:MAG: endo-1,4-beta-xylanase [Opitutaceae bacterium]|jgi:GH35 family endo-1,4-beta-xylanase|nr:endo-1,4-beta-xylanase [Opitutaceae bacterium]
MKAIHRILALFIIYSSLYIGGLAAGAPNPAMSDAYWQIWNPAEQERIDRDIERHRKAAAALVLPGAPAGADIFVEQLSHDFIFGAHIFNFDQLGTPERNRRHKALYGDDGLFNSATISFYWKTFEPEPGLPRFAGDERDTEAFWNACAEPKNQPHWRRPASDPVVAFCESKGVRLHGHPMIWGHRKWQHPAWLVGKICPPDEREKLLSLGKKGLDKLTPAQIAALAPRYAKELRRLFEKRVVELAERYQGRVHSWDVANESAKDFSQGRMVPGDDICKSTYGIMPGDYTWHAFQTAARALPKNVLLNINDYLAHQDYTDQVLDLLKRGCRVDIMGSQMHLFKPEQCLDLAEGRPVAKYSGYINSPRQIRDQMAVLAKAGRPIHISEITLTSIEDDARGRQIQAVLARNFYRAWFSVPEIMGITWWNVVDDCGAPGEPSFSGLFTRDMQPKPAHAALDNLINHEWKTRLALKAGEGGRVAFRGFKGKYRVTWRDTSGAPQTATFHLAKDGDGL